MRDLILGILLAATASLCFNLAIVIQAGEARQVEQDGMSLALLPKLLRRPRWVGGLLLQVVVVPLQTLALTIAPLAVVQPSDAAGLIVLLAAGSRMLGEPVGSKEIASVAAIIIGVAGVAVGAPAHSDTSAALPVIVAVLAPLALLAFSPYLLGRRVSGSVMVLAAGLTFALSAFMLKLLADSLIAAAWAAAAGVVLVLIVLGITGVNSEQSALRLRPVATVAPVIFVMEMAIPIALGVLIGGESLPATGWKTLVLLVSLAVTVVAAVTLIRSAAVGGMIEAEKGPGASAS